MVLLQAKNERQLAGLVSIQGSQRTNRKRTVKVKCFNGYTGKSAQRSQKTPI